MPFPRLYRSGLGTKATLIDSYYGILDYAFWSGSPILGLFEILSFHHRNCPLAKACPCGRLAVLQMQFLMLVASCQLRCQSKGQTKGNATIVVRFAGFVVSVIAGCVLWAHFGCLITHVNQASKQRRHAVNLCVMAAKVVGLLLPGWPESDNKYAWLPGPKGCHWGGPRQKGSQTRRKGKPKTKITKNVGENRWCHKGAQYEYELELEWKGKWHWQWQ